MIMIMVMSDDDDEVLIGMCVIDHYSSAIRCKL